MIPGVNELCGVFETLRKLEVVEDGMDLGNAANYAMCYSPNKINMAESSGTENVWEDVSAEEMEALKLCDPEQADMYDDILDDLLLEEDDG